MFHRRFAVALLFLTSHTFAQNLEAILSDTKLPDRVYSVPVVYDGEDSIYILGRYGVSGHQRDMLKFDVTTQRLEKIGTMDSLVYGNAVWTGNKNILYFGGYNGTGFQAKVFNYKPDESYWTRVGDLPRDAGHTSIVWGQGEYSYVFGGYNNYGLLNTISRYSSVTHTSVVIGELPGPRFATSAIWDEITGDAFVFGGNGPSGRLNDIVKFNPVKNTVLKLNVTLSEETGYTCAIWTGTEAYIIGGSTNTNGQVARLNPSTNEVLNIPVNNLPTNLHQHGCAFVKKLNRIYVFGGISDGSYSSEIMYIDLGPIQPEPIQLQ